MWLKMLIHLRGFCEVEFREEEERSVDSFGRVKPLSKLCEGQTGWILYVCCRGFSRSQNVHLDISWTSIKSLSKVTFYHYPHRKLTLTQLLSGAFPQHKISQIKIL